MPEYGERIKKLRLEAGLTQAELAKICGVSQNALYNWENEKREPGIAVLQKLAAFFGITVDYLLGSENVSNTPQTIAAHFNGEEYTEEELEKIKEFAAFVKANRKTTFKPTASDSNVPEHITLNAAHARTDIEVTDEMRKHDDDIMNDDKLWK